MFTSHSPAGTIAPILGLHHFRYAESLDPPDSSTEKGTFKVVGIEARQNIGKLEFTESYAYAWASLHYAGTTLDTHQPVEDDHNHHFHLFEVLVALPIGADVSVYTGLQHRRWYRDLGAYTETYRLTYLPFGLTWTHSSGNLRYGLDASLRPLIHGNLFATTSNFDPSYNDLTLPVSKGIGWRLAFPVALVLGPQSSLNLTPFYQTLKIGEGEVVPFYPGSAAGAMEPASVSHEYGASLALTLTL